MNLTGFNSRIYKGVKCTLQIDNCSHLLIARTICWASLPATVPVIAFIELTTIRNYLTYVFANQFTICPAKPHPHLTSPNQTFEVCEARNFVFFNSISLVAKTKPYIQQDFNRYIAFKKINYIHIRCYTTRFAKFIWLERLSSQRILIYFMLCNKWVVFHSKKFRW